MLYENKEALTAGCIYKEYVTLGATISFTSLLNMWIKVRARYMGYFTARSDKAKFDASSEALHREISSNSAYDKACGFLDLIKHKDSACLFIWFKI